MSETDGRIWRAIVEWTCTAARHDTLSANKTFGCTCPAAIAERNAYQRDVTKRGILGVPPRRVPADGTRLRLRALAADGWPVRHLAGRLDTDHSVVSQWTNGSRVRSVLRSSSEKVAALYAELAGTPGPSKSAAKRAAAKGWLPPECLDDERVDEPGYNPCAADPAGVDEVVVERFLMWARRQPTGQQAFAAALHCDPRPPIGDGERVEATRRLLADGLSPSAIGVLLGRGGAYLRSLIEVAS